MKTKLPDKIRIKVTQDIIDRSTKILMDGGVMRSRACPVSLGANLATGRKNASTGYSSFCIGRATYKFSDRVGIRISKFDSSWIMSPFTFTATKAK